MEKEVAVKIENIGKKYVLGDSEKYLVLREAIVKAVKVPFNLIRGKGFKKKKEFWALKNIDLEVEKGDVVGIIGRNGAGKSTLLKILSRITEPTEGLIAYSGRVASLLEVGTGFHPELTGRENVYLNGAILGMARKEIEEKFEEIIDFSGVRDFIDVPVKRYSSGMQVRLAFSVAAHLDSDIMIIDEVLAVGDAEFQKKCLGKMDQVTKDSGRTIFFVSHDLGAVQRLCKKVVWLDKGQIVMVGNTSQVIDKYVNDINSLSEYSYDVDEKMPISILKATLLSQNNTPTSIVNCDEGFKIDIEYSVNFDHNQRYDLALILDSATGSRVFSTACSDSGLKLQNKEGKYKIRYTFPTPNGIYINPGYYWFRASVGLTNSKPMTSVDNISLTIKEPLNGNLVTHVSRKLNVNLVDGKWEE